MASPSDRMRSLGIAQEGESVLAERAQQFDMPAEARQARQVISQLARKLEQISRVYTSAKGLGLAAPQVYVSYATAVIRSPEGRLVPLINPRVVNESPEIDEQYEACPSSLDMRGKVPRPLLIEVEHQRLDGSLRVTTFQHNAARMVHHEIDHLNGTLYRARMRPENKAVSVSQYEGTSPRFPPLGLLDQYGIDW